MLGCLHPAWRNTPGRGPSIEAIEGALDDIVLIVHMRKSFFPDTKVAYISGGGDLDIFNAVSKTRTTLVSRDVFVSIEMLIFLIEYGCGKLLLQNQRCLFLIQNHKHHQKY